MLFVSFTKGPGGFRYVFIITRKVTTLEPIYGPTFADHRVFLLGGDQWVPDSITTFEVGLYAIPPSDLFDTFTKTLCIGYDNVTFGFNFIGSRLGTCSALVVSPIRSLPRMPIKPSLHFVQSPFGVFALCKCIPEVGLLFAEKLRIATNCLGPVGKGVDKTKLSSEVVVTVPLFVLVHMGRFPVHSDRHESHQPLVLQWCPRRGWPHPPYWFPL